MEHELHHFDSLHSFKSFMRSVIDLSEFVV